MEIYLVSWNGTKMRVMADSPKNAAHRRLLDTGEPPVHSGFITVYEQETEDSNITSHVFNVADRKCSVCGCTENQACANGCAWVDWDLCSVCLMKAV
jgi:hypothetical protein